MKFPKKFAFKILFDNFLKFRIFEKSLAFFEFSTNFNLKAILISQKGESRRKNVLIPPSNRSIFKLKHDASFATQKSHFIFPFSSSLKQNEIYKKVRLQNNPQHEQ